MDKDSKGQRKLEDSGVGLLPAVAGSGMDKDSKGQRKLEDSGVGLLPAVAGSVWTRTAKDRESWRTLAEGYSLQWKDTS